MPDQEFNQHQKAGPLFFYGYIMVAILFIIQLAMFGPSVSFGVFFKPVIAEFGWPRALISGAFSLSKILQGLSSVVMGGLNDRLGPRVVLSLCGLLLGVGYLLMSRIGSSWQLYLFYVLFIGLGMGGILAPQMSTVARWFMKRRSVMTGFVIAGGGIGGIIAPPIINSLITTYGWRDSYVIIGVLVLVVVIVAAQFLKRDPSQKGLKPYGENKGQKQELVLPAEGLSIRETVRTRQLWILVTVLFCFGFCVNMVMVHIVPHITDLGISAETAAGIFAMLGVPVLISSILMGNIGDRIGNRLAYTICFILISASMLWLLVAREVWMLYLFVLVFGFGAGGATTIVSPLAAELFGIRSHGLIYGIILFCQTIGSAIGPFLAGYIFDVNGSYQLAFIILAVASISGLILSALLKPVAPRDSSRLYPAIVK